MATVDLPVKTTAYLRSPFGTLAIEGSMLGVRAVYVTTVIEWDVPKPISDTHPVAICKQQLIEYFDKKRTVFDMPFDWSSAPPFHKAVWEALLHIPFGQTVSYLDIAESLGDPKAVRAVGQANGKNPIAIIVPCHRVIGKNGHLTGYAGGLDMKMALLRFENPQRFPIQTRLFD